LLDKEREERKENNSHRWSLLFHAITNVKTSEIFWIKVEWKKKSHKKHQMNQPAGSKNRYDRIELLFLTANKVDNRYKE